MADTISQRQADRAIEILEEMPGEHLTNIVDQIEEALSSQRGEDVELLCRHFGCNEKMLSHRILGWKEFAQRQSPVTQDESL